MFEDFATVAHVMKGQDAFAAMLAGGHPNSLGRTVEVVELVLAAQPRLRELFDCYTSADDVVRLRTSNAVKRVSAEQHSWLLPSLDELIDDVGALQQASAQWTISQLLLRYTNDLSTDQMERAKKLLQGNLLSSDDWIVLNQTLETLAEWARTDSKLASWLRPHLDRLSKDPRKSVASRAAKKQKLLFGKSSS